MSKKTSTLEKIAIGALGVIGGLLIGKAVSQSSKSSKVKVENQGQNQTTYTDVENYDKMEELMTCPITCCIMTEPYIIPECGHNFQKDSIIEYVNKNKICALCRTETSVESLKPNFQLKSIIEEYQKSKKQMKKEETQQ